MAPKDITGAEVGSFAAMTYNGTAQTPEAIVTVDGLAVTGSWSEVTNVADGTTYTATGNFIGTLERTPGMAPKDIAGAEVGSFAAMTYNGTAQTPEATVTVDGLAVTGSWSEVTNVADSTTYTATGNFIGTLDRTPGMAPKDITATVTADKYWDGTTTRAQIVTILWRLEGKPVLNYLMQFEDVASESWYTEAVRWAAAVGIVTGYSAEQFAPNDAITREQMATILYRYVQYKGGGFTGMWMFLLDYPDRADVSEWAYEAMCWMTMNEIINGVADGDSVKLDPAGSATRAQTATMLWRFCKLIKED